MSTENPSIADAQTEIHTIANDTDLLAPHNHNASMNGLPAIHSPNKNRNNRHPRNKPSTNGNHQQTMLSRTPKPNNPWKQSNKAPKFENIMNEQQKQRSKNRKSNNHTQYNYNYNNNSNYNEDPFGMLDEETLLEQQLLFQAIAEFNQSSQLTQSTTTKSHNSSSPSSSSPHSVTNANDQLTSDKDDEKHAITIEPTSTNTNTHTTTTTKTSNVDDDEIAAAAAVDDESIVESTNKVNPMQGISDEMLAIHLQREEQHQLQRQQKLKERFNGKYAKVTSSSSELAPIPKSALKFYYDDECILNGDAGLTKNELQGQTLELNDREISSPSKRERLKKQSKHDIKRWSDTHMHRLNEYENAGNLDMNRSIGNKAYNAFRNQLDQKGYISYHNYALEPKDK